MGSRSFQFCKIVFFFSFFILFSQTRAQGPIVPEPLANPNPPQNPNSTAPSSGSDNAGEKSSKSIIIDEPSKKYDIIINPGKDVYGNQLDPNKTKVQEPWNRPAGGLFGGIANSGVIEGGYRITDDTIMRGKTREFGFGLGAFVDFPNPALGGTALRVKMGAYRMSFSHNSELKQRYPDQLEKRATLIHLGGLLKFPLGMDLPLGHSWIGAGGHMNYALSTKRPAGVSEASQISGTYLFAFDIAAGTEVPLNSFNDLCFEINYIPLKAFSLNVGIRTSL